MHILVTGAAGFVGSYTVEKLIKEGHRVYGIDCINDYYDISLKHYRLQQTGISGMEFGKTIESSVLPGYRFQQADLCDKKNLSDIFRQQQFDCVINLAAQAGVRYSLTNPDAYIQSNIVGFSHILECCREHACNILLYASSSSVYGNNSSVPFKETEQVDNPVSMYAATKKSNELMAYTYSSLYGIKTIGLRFFTVYGPAGRPDMAPFLFADAIWHEKPIKVFNEGNLSRDFTYIDDIVEGISKIVAHPENASYPADVPAIVYNIGHGSPVKLMEFIQLLEENIGKEAIKEYVGMQAGDVFCTWADTNRLFKDYNYKPETSLEEGIKKFIDWFKSYYR
ncbi:NAD-dependent epimerase/dehydratase family protein [Porphyromonadaceae bacterium OttesenSCG-928-L07]|nr:NAD-dependent epimerase/dehydratase family protein [Porphyromonadaceae bacterium OttesenSCG-928-L07]